MGARARTSTPPREAYESIEIVCEDGKSLRATVREPPRGVKANGVAVLAHAMFARRSEFARPGHGGLAPFLGERGWRTIAFDFRGHGDSGPGAASGGTWSYDDLLQRDLPAVVGCARARTRRGPVVVIGHSLGGHLALAAEGMGKLGADAIVGLATNVWLRALEPSLARWAAKVATFALVHRVAERRGYFPARALHLGSDDEALEYVRALTRWTREGFWGSADGRIDYFANLPRVRVPVMHVASAGDRLNCHPESSQRMLLRCGGQREFLLVREADDGRGAPGHMGLVTTPRAMSAWGRVDAWLRAVTSATFSTPDARAPGKSSPG